MDEIKYANNVEIQMQLYDFKIKFDTRNSEETFDSTTVYMSPQHAKVFCSALQGAITEYEKIFGKINLPENALNISIQGSENN